MLPASLTPTPEQAAKLLRADAKKQALAAAIETARNLDKLGAFANGETLMVFSEYGDDTELDEAENLTELIGYIKERAIAADYIAVVPAEQPSFAAFEEPVLGIANMVAGLAELIGPQTYVYRLTAPLTATIISPNVFGGDQYALACRYAHIPIFEVQRCAACDCNEIGWRISTLHSTAAMTTPEAAAAMITAIESEDVK